MKQESAAMYRDLAINYLRDNTYNGKNPISLSEEILLTLDIINKSHGHVPNEFDITTIEYQIYGDTFDQVTKSLNTEQLEAFLYIANFVIGSGLKPNNNGTYTFKNDEEVIQDLEHIKNNPKDTSNILNIELVTHLFTRYQQLRANLDTMQPEQIQDLIDKMYHNQYAENRTGNNKR